MSPTDIRRHNQALGVFQRQYDLVSGVGDTVMSPADIRAHRMALRSTEVVFRSVEEHVINGAHLLKYADTSAQPTGCLRLLEQPFHLKAKRVVLTGETPQVEEFIWNAGARKSLLSDMVRVRGAKKQTAARAYRPIESMRVVKETAPKTIEEVFANIDAAAVEKVIKAEPAKLVDTSNAIQAEIQDIKASIAKILASMKK
jgi:hypothetical protein